MELGGCRFLTLLETQTSVIRNYINSIVKDSCRNFKDAPAYSVVLRDNVDYGTGRGTRIVFDAKENNERSVRVLSPQELKRSHEPVPNGTTERNCHRLECESALHSV